MSQKMLDHYNMFMYIQNNFNKDMSDEMFERGYMSDHLFEKWTKCDNILEFISRLDDSNKFKLFNWASGRLQNDDN